MLILVFWILWKLKVHVAQCLSNVLFFRITWIFSKHVYSGGTMLRNSDLWIQCIWYHQSTHQSLDMRHLFRPLHCTDEKTEVFLQQGWERLELGSQRVRGHEDEGLKTWFLTSLVSWGSLSVDRGEKGNLGWGWILMVSWLSTLYLAVKLDCFGATRKIFCLCWTCILNNVECILKCILLLDMVPIQTFLTVWGRCGRR